MAGVHPMHVQAEWYNPLSWFSSDNAVGGEWDEVKKDLEKIFDEEPNHGTKRRKKQKSTSFFFPPHFFG